MKNFILLLLICNVSFGQQNLKENYTPLKSSGQLPPVFTQNIRTVINKDINDLNNSDDKDKELKSTYITASNYQIERIIRSGNVLINDEVTKYLGKVADVILKDDPALRSQINIYTLKSSVVNAYSFDKGYIFVDIGLIAQAENEAQLAYILCHEIAHYTKKHNINSYVRESKIEGSGYDAKNFEDKLVEKCQYSKEVESEADVEGFKLFEKTKYNVKQAEKAFDMLQYARLPFELVEFKKTFFETNGYIIPQKYFLKEVSPITNRSYEDDSKSTHPNTANRKLAIAELVRQNNSTERINAIVGKEEFEYIRDLSRMEICRLYLKYRDYPNALYSAYILHQKYPANEYVNEIMSKCVYAIALYNNGLLKYDDASYFKDGVLASTEIEGYPQQVYFFINIMPNTDWTIMSLNYVYRQHKKFPENKNIARYSDSLFKLMKKIDWGITDFTRTTKKEGDKLPEDTVKEPVSKTDLINSLQKKTQTVDDSVYYKNVFVDLFMNDEEFNKKFPASAPVNVVAVNKGYGIFERNQEKQKGSGDLKLSKALLLEPFYLKIDETQKEKYQYVDSDTKQEDFINVVNNSAKQLNFELITIDPGLMNASDVEKINDYSVINDWLSEKFDTRQNKSNIFNTNDVDNLIEKYGTRYVLKTGMVSFKSSDVRKSTYFLAYIYDLKKNEVVYRKYERFKRKDTKDLVNAKAYQLIYELKNLNNE